MKRPHTISLTEQELYEITRDVMTRTTGKHSMEFNSRLMHEVSKTYSLLRSMEREPASWYWRHTNKLMVFAGVSFLFLTAKILAENLAAK